MLSDRSIRKAHFLGPINYAKIHSVSVNMWSRTANPHPTRVHTDVTETSEPVKLLGLISFVAQKSHLITPFADQVVSLG